MWKVTGSTLESSKNFFLFLILLDLSLKIRKINLRVDSIFKFKFKFTLIDSNAPRLIIGNL